MHESGMEAEEIQQAPACKFPRVGNGRNDSSKIGSKGVSDHYPDDEEDGELNRAGNVVPGSDAGGNANRLRGWNHSRIIRVSRASGGKDRHSKVWTSKGLRDRRVRLSVTSAIQFYDLQDRLGYDQPSKAVEWLIKAAADAIAELPSLNSAFPDTPKQLSDEKRASGCTEQGFDSAEVELDGDPNFQQNQSQHLSLSKSACSSTSETSKGPGLSLSESKGIMISRASGGEDRDSKVLTSKGLRDRRIRLSVTTAIQFYDVQDRLGYDRPSKAVEWLIKAAADAISELPSLNNSFPETSKQLSQEKRASGDTEQGFDSVAEVELDGDPNFQQNQSQNISSFSKSACDSTSETPLTMEMAIRFYDLQDRLGYDQPSKAVEWLIKAAADAIAELPSLNSAFPDTPKQLSDEKRASGGTEQGFDSAEVELDGDPNFQQNQSQHLSLSKSACSSTSETSKGSGLSLSRSEIRVKARERARERVAKEKQKENDSGIAQNVNHISHNASFTELLTDGVRSVNNNATLPIEWNYQNPDGEPNLLHKAARQWSCAIPMDYSESGLLGPSSGVQHSSRFSGHVHLGNSIPQAMTTSAVNANSWDRMKCFKASSPGIEFCPSSTNKLFPGVCLVPNGAVQGLCHGEDRKWFTRGCPRNIGWLALVGLITFCIMFFSPGMGIVPGIFNPEISLMYRGICGGIAATANWISNLIVPQSVLTLTHAFESSWTFLIFLAISVVALFFSLINVPETKGLPI
ncbi:hypothetical protein I3842_09G119000 [Carya illinoinensis]|uniref:Uncharacterized protein n=1 Tax=Carya illinoinensis TaxID=32201 RepID=A0A922E4X1_CARIL|nr:hypothetical protein I3842_09G119000 [Carya illinoinensis]